MNLIDAVTSQGGKLELPNCSRNELPELFEHLGYKVGVEVGVWKGKFTRHLCTKADIEIYGVDPWTIYDDFYDIAEQYPWRTRNRWVEQEQFDQIQEVAKWRLQDLKNCHIIKKTSMDAVKDFKNESIDFVYIDANHFIKYISEDIWEWTKKVKKGGIVSGHDYLDRDISQCQVKSVVDLYVRVFDIKNWYILKADKEPTWMWFK